MFNCIKNLSAVQVTPLENPQDSWAEFPLPKEVSTKEKFKKFCKDPATEHCFISLVEGDSPNTRVNKENEPRYIKGIIADYDTPISEDELQEYLDKEPPSPYLPLFLTNSFSTGKHRMVWAFERPILVANKKHAYALNKLLATRLKLKTWLPGFDEGALKPDQYFEVGTEWVPMGREKVPTEVVLGWVAHSAKSINVPGPVSQPDVPIEAIAELVDDQYPGRWSGPFALGSRGVRFWDSSADNDSAAVVLEHGMLCFTGVKGFVSWSEIFGMEALDTAFGASVGTLRDDLYYDGRRYYMREENYGYREHSKEDMSHHLFTSCGLSKQRVKGAPSSLDKFENDIRMNKRVDLAMPFVYRDPGPINYLGKKYLNTLETQFMEPGPAYILPDDGEMDLNIAGPEMFPFIHSFYMKGFEAPAKKPSWCPEDVDNPAPYIQLAWLARVYRGACARNPVRAQALVLAGDQGVGKTFNVEGIMAKILGPTADGTSHLVDGSEWTDEIVRSPLLFVDDSVASNTEHGLKRFTANIKKLTANKSIFFNKKFGSAGKAEWYGNVILACNTDFESIRILPDMEMATKDKFILLQMRKGVTLPGYDKQEELLSAELPAFARFLLTWDIPAWCYAPMGSAIRNRFGIRNYHHSTLFEAAVSSGAPAAVLECLIDMYESGQTEIHQMEQLLAGVKAINPNPDNPVWRWKGRINLLHRELSNHLTPAVMGRITPAMLMRGLGALESRGFPIHRERGIWHIEFSEKLYTTNLNDAEDEDAA